ncbi:ubiquitin carboxyl-terminal hydrolase 47-like [Boleophthalmus pectinirostris]|uniref:ubiquitin carboxyl-terminal hydrolase 47-like n=1 Tax=Boleophthalmus pectinirostris TaxID=150288 RepID=UPI00242DBF59|nr:ubiquitin carboxyl-terminal hydrolase 47-like [Boleophthalmus pectinirostris]
MYCENCDKKCDAVLGCEVKDHPEVLVLLLKRFEFDYSSMVYVKINQPVNVPQTLQMSGAPHSVSPTLERSRRAYLLFYQKQKETLQDNISDGINKTTEKEQVPANELKNEETAVGATSLHE